MPIIRFVTLAVASVPSPTSQNGDLQPDTHLAGISILIAERNEALEWSLDLRTRAIAAGEGEDALLIWATDAMPETGVAIGWQLAERTIPPLLGAGTSGDPEIGHAFLERLAGLVTDPSIDIAVDHRGAGALGLHDFATDRGVPMTPLTPDQLLGAWGIGQRAPIETILEAEAIAIWRLWLGRGGDDMMFARAATDQWLNPRRAG